MAKLNAKKRKSLPDRVFAGPGRSFPINDKSHARAALRMLNRAKDLSGSDKAKIKRRANNKLGLRGERSGNGK